MSITAPLKLSQTKPDFESLLMQLQLYLNASGTWTDLQTSSTGETLMEMMAAVGTFNQFAIEGAARETTLTTAARDSSIYAITRMLGVRIHRKYPAGVDVALSRIDTASSIAIAPYTVFSVNGKDFFNRNPLMFAQGSTKASERLFYGTSKEVVDTRSLRLDLSAINVSKLSHQDTFVLLVNSGPDNGKLKNVVYVGGNVGDDLFQLVDSETSFLGLTTATRISLLRNGVRLYEGTIKQETILSDGAPFKEVYLAESSFNISDVDVRVQVINVDNNSVVTWGLTSEGMWTAGPNENVYYDSTSGLGDTIITFGDGLTGAIPTLGNVIKFTYAVTGGSAANNGLTNLQVASAQLAWVSGVTTSVISGGADQKPSSYYRFMAPLIFKARNRGVTDADYRAVSLDYPGIISASISAQRDIAPYDLRWMNQLRVCLLPIDTSVTALTTSEWNEFLLYMKKKRHAAVNIVTINPTVQNAVVELTLALKQQYVSSSVVPVAEAKVQALFNRQSDTLGRRIPVSDVVRAAMVEGVDYVDVDKCKLTTYSLESADLVPNDLNHFIVLDSLLISSKYSERSIYSDGSN